MRSALNSFLFLFVFVLMETACASIFIGVPANPLQGKFTRDGSQQSSELEFLKDIESHDVILLGEEHPNAHHHDYQKKIIDHLRSKFGIVDVGFELAPRNFQWAFDQVMLSKATVDDIKTLIDWDKTWGFDFNLYKPLFESALNGGGKIIALDAPRELTKKINRVSLAGLDPSFKKMLPSKLIHDTADFKKWFMDKLKALHGGKSYPHFENMYESWVVRNSVMAEQTFKFKRKNIPFVIIVGNGHIEGNRSLVTSLHNYFHPQQVLAFFQQRVPDSTDVSELKSFSDPASAVFNLKAHWIKFTP